MRKRVWRLLGLLAVLTLLAGVCTAGAQEKTRIKFWTFHSNYEKEFMISLGQEYMKVNPNVEIVYENIPESEYMGAKLTTAFAANSGPDVFVISPGDFLKYANSGLALDLTPYFTDKIRADFLKSSLDAVTVKGKIYAIPFEVELLGLYYNKDMLAKANVAPPKTWQELIGATKKLKTDQVAGLVIEPQRGYYQNFTWYPFLWQGGGTVINVQTKKSAFKGRAVENALKLWADLIKAGAPSKLAKGTWEPFIGDGSAAMQICGTWIIARLEKDFADKNIGLVPLPTPPGGKAATDAGGWKFMVNGKSKNADAAAKFAMWALAENVNLPLKWCTEVKFAYSPRKSVVQAGAAIYGKGLRKVFTDQIYETAIGEPRYPAEIVGFVGDALQEVMFKNVAPRQAAQKADQKIKQFLKDFKGSM
ncbi:carbohydrate ABC transporter substrate-binding protein (CUT1 family) [Hydrogenispora ethanolica]|uniref:Carbohydrate ABC transporter substrate-binding protein (CUT1 family) n=1 Tax=Hydrogenispora ethanolica TaxID=1082276 RepID=A0A4V2QCS8_HYDET|nr:sugar ABC transporter substrate-binding protein [Hydrogenispora ethanolica]TCL61497.1 carbohydrate ABC transporter substrate-binding protein (CUT1 family) [Hydrogenispora ethanolica]